MRAQQTVAGLTCAALSPSACRPVQMRWFVDGRPYATQVSGAGSRSGWFSLGPSPQGDMATAAPLPGNTPFDSKFHLILNLALGSEGTAFTTVSERGQGERCCTLECLGLFSCATVGRAHCRG